MKPKKNIDDYYKDWCGESHTVNSCHPVHDSAEAEDFAQFYHDRMMEEQECRTKEDFTLYDLSGISAQEKDMLINDFSVLTATNAMKVYRSLGLKHGFEAKMHNEPTNEDFILSFKKA